MKNEIKTRAIAKRYNPKNTEHGVFSEIQVKQITEFALAGLYVAEEVTLKIPIISGHPHEIWIEIDNENELTKNENKYRDKISKEVSNEIMKYGKYIKEEKIRKSEMILKINRSGKVESKYRNVAILTN